VAVIQLLAAIIILTLFGLIVLFFIFGLMHVYIDVKVIDFHLDLKVSLYLWKLRLTTFSFSDIVVDTSRFIKNKADDGTYAEDKADKTSARKKVAIPTYIKYDLEALGKLLNMIHIHKIKWATTIGLDDAQLSAIISGVIWAIKGQIMAFLFNRIKQVERPIMDVRPVFQGWAFSTHFTCMISFRIGKTILAVYRIAKRWKRRQRLCRNIQYKA